MSNEQPKTKICKKCGQELPIEYFGKNRATKDGLQIYCKDCQKAQVYQSRERNKENLIKMAKGEDGNGVEKDQREGIWERKSEARACLDVLPDSELLAELRRRGYIGKVYKKIKVVL